MAFESRTCSRCTREVLVEPGYDGPVRCEFCSGREVGFHEEMRRKRLEAERQRLKRRGR